MLAPRTASDRGRPPGADQAATPHAGGEPGRKVRTVSSAGARSVSLENRTATSMPFSWAARLGQSAGQRRSRDITVTTPLPRFTYLSVWRG